MSWIRFDVRKIVANILLAITSIIIIITLAEIFVRIFPPKGVYSPSVYDDEIGLIIYPESKVIYNKVRYTESFTNKDGFLDVDHQQGNNRKIKVAFWGDSYVEAMQVTSKQRFFRLLPETIGKNELEYFGFGISGQGTLHSYLNYRKQSKKYDFDVVVYVFVENDLGDNILSISNNNLRPMAKLSESSPTGFEINNEYKKYNSLFFRMSRSINRHSLLANIVVQKIILLKQKGIMLKLNEEEKKMTTVAKGNAPEQNNLPSTWPAPVKEYAEKLGFNILKEWNKEVRDAGKDFIVFYVPRSEETLYSSPKDNDSWKMWLQRSCATLNIQFIDPSDSFIRERKQGVQIYDDHWTPEGHIIVAHIIEEWLTNYFKMGN